MLLLMSFLLKAIVILISNNIYFSLIKIYMHGTNIKICTEGVNISNIKIRKKMAFLMQIGSKTHMHLNR